MGLQYAVVWIFLLAFPVITAWKRYWAACSVFVLACMIFLTAVMQNHDGWDSLTDVATLLAVVFPMYGLGLIAWAVSYFLRIKRNKRQKP